jgi:hypothetical protein
VSPLKPSARFPSSVVTSDTTGYSRGVAELLVDHVCAHRLFHIWKATLEYLPSVRVLALDGHLDASPSYRGYTEPVKLRINSPEMMAALASRARAGAAIIEIKVMRATMMHPRVKAQLEAVGVEVLLDCPFENDGPEQRGRP